MMAEPASRRRYFQCSLCPSSFYHKRNLDDHIRRHLEERRFVCNQCSYTANTSSDLAGHMMAVHEKLDPSKCSPPCCNYSSGRSVNLKQHRRSHDADPCSSRPFPCEFPGCNYRATQKSDLKKHIRRRHNDNRTKDFGCLLCPATFYEEQVLRQHINKSHVKGTTDNCSKWHHKSLRECRVRTHLKTVHCDTGRDGEPRHGPESSGKELNIDRIHDRLRFERTPPADGTEVAHVDIGADPNFIFQCTICHYVAQSQQEAWEHSKVHTAHSASPYF